MLKPVEDTMGFLGRTYGRIGSRAVLLVVKDIPWDQISVLGSFELKNIPNLEWLMLHVSEALPRTWPSLLEALNRPNIDLKRLDIIIEHTDLEAYGRQTGTIRDFSQNLRHLNITGGFLIRIELPGTYPTIQYLSIRSVQFTLINMVQHIPNLEVLEVIDSIVVNREIKLEIPSLKKLRIHQIRHQIPLNEWLRSLSCPALTELSIDKVSGGSTIIDFIKRHKSITALKLNSGIVTQELVDSAPQLQHLTIRNMGKELYSPRLRGQAQFPRLQTLAISDFGGEIFKEEFEGLVIARCLPVHHPKSRLLEGCTPLDRLGVIVFTTNKVGDMGWGESKLVEKNKAWIEADDTWDCSRMICMSWSGHGLSTVA